MLSSLLLMHKELGGFRKFWYVCPFWFFSMYMALVDLEEVYSLQFRPVLLLRSSTRNTALGIARRTAAFPLQVPLHLCNCRVLRTTQQRIRHLMHALTAENSLWARQDRRAAILRKNHLWGNLFFQPLTTSKKRFRASRQLLSTTF